MMSYQQKIVGAFLACPA